MSRPITNNIIPYVGMPQIIRLINALPDDGITTLSELQLQVKNAPNIIPTASGLKLIEYKKQIIKLTNFGLQVKRADEKKRKTLISTKVKKIKPLMYIKNLLEKENSLSIEKIGEALKLKYKKNWSPIASKAYSYATASILSYCGHVSYMKGIIFKSNASWETSIPVSFKMPLPEVTSKRILTLLGKFQESNIMSIREFAEKTKIDKNKAYYITQICLEWNLLTILSNGENKLTENGKEIVGLIKDKRKKSQEKLKELLRKSLMASRHKTIIDKIVRKVKSDVFTSPIIGNILCNELERNWTKEVKRKYGENFVEWMYSAGLAERIRRGKYKINPSFFPWLKEEKEKEEEIHIEEKSKILEDYTLWKVIGAVFSQARNEKMSENIDKLFRFCEENEELKEIGWMLKRHSEFCEKYNDYQIILPDIELLEMKILHKRTEK